MNVYDQTCPLAIKLKSIIDTLIWSQIVKACDFLYMGFVYKAAILFSFFSFVHISNLVPHSIKTFDPLKQLAWADICFAQPPPPLAPGFNCC